MRTVVVVFGLLASSSGLADEPPVVSLWLERGGNHESLGNERFIVKWDHGVVYERGRGVETKDPRYGKVTVGACDRWTFRLDDAAHAAFRKAVADAKLSTLEARYAKQGVHDGSQAQLMVSFPGKTQVTYFDNEFPPQYRAISDWLTKNIAAVAEKQGKATACDTKTWFFLTPPGDRR